MKYLKQLCFLALTAILFSSCGSISISQKRYSNGLNISWFGGKDDVKATKKTTKKSHVKTTEVVQKEEAAVADMAESKKPEMTASTVETEVLEVPLAAIAFDKKSQVSKASQKEATTDKRTEKQLRKIDKLQKAIQLSKVQEKHDGGGALKTIGWIFIILGIIFVLIISILIGVLFMLLGLLFVIAGK